MVTVSSEDQDALLSFCLQLAPCNIVVSADCIQCVGSMYNCMNTFLKKFLSNTRKQYTLSSDGQYILNIV
jgi:hypothetical protein